MEATAILALVGAVVCASIGTAIAMLWVRLAHRDLVRDADRRGFSRGYRAGYDEGRNNLPPRDCDAAGMVDERPGPDDSILIHPSDYAALMRNWRDATTPATGTGAPPSPPNQGSGGRR